MNVSIRPAAGSFTGLVRKHNEDSAYLGQWLYAVADGMGGHAAGDVASATVIKALSHYDNPAPSGSLDAVIGAAVIAANAAIRQRTDADPTLRTMGTTLTATLWNGPWFALAHIGDSRAYMLREGRLCQLTEDHALANLVSAARVVPSLAPMMTRFLDGRADRSPDISIHEARLGDRYLLCSDGLTAVVPPRDVQAVLETDSDPRENVRQFAALADQGGAPDNVTVIVIDVAAARLARRPCPELLGAAASASD